MNLIFRAMRFLFWVLVLSWSVALLRRVFERLLNPAKPSVSGADVSRVDPEVQPHRRLVRDPVCGVHVAEFRAIPLGDGDRLLHFCSPSCRDRYLSSAKKLAAAG